jgi:hypothetical protein
MLGVRDKAENQSKIDSQVQFAIEVSRTIDVSQWKLIRIREQVLERIYTKFNNIKMNVCQMINYIIFQIFI